jgi:hypothetical protein
MLARLATRAIAHLFARWIIPPPSPWLDLANFIRERIGDIS